MTESDRVRALDRHLEGVALEAGYQPRDHVLVLARQGSVLWNLLPFDQHGQRLILLGPTDTCTLVSFSLLRAAKDVGVIRRSSMYVTSRPHEGMVRLRGYLERDRRWSRGITLQISGAEYCHRFLRFYDAHGS